MDDEEFEGVDIKLLEVLLEVAYDMYQAYDEAEGNAGWTFREIRRFSSQWNVEVLQAALKEGIHLGYFQQVGYKTHVTERLLALLDRHQTTWYTPDVTDLFVQFYGIERI